MLRSIYESCLDLLITVALVFGMVIILLAPFTITTLAKKAPTTMPETKALLGTLRDRVILKKLSAEKETRGGIVLPESQKNQISRGVVFAVGRGSPTLEGKIIPLEAKSGDEVIFHLGTTNEFELEGETFYCVKESDILAVVKRPTTSSKE